MVQVVQRKFAIFAAVVAAAASLVGCRKDQNQAAWWQGEQERIKLSLQLELGNLRAEQVGTRDVEALEKQRRLTREAAPLLSSLRQQRLTLNEELKSLEGRWAGFRQSIIREQRQRAMAKSLSVLDLASGRKFQNVSVSAIDDAGVTIRHADGSARLRFADLDADQRVFFGLEADLALAAAEKEARDAAAYERWIDTRMASIEAQKEKSSQIAKREELVAQRERASLAAQQLAASPTRPLAQAATSVGDRSWRDSGSYSNFRVRRPTYRYVYYYNTSGYNNTLDCNNSCMPAVTIPSPQVRVPYVAPIVVLPCKSFANTTLPSIP